MKKYLLTAMSLFLTFEVIKASSLEDDLYPFSVQAEQKAALEKAVRADRPNPENIRFLVTQGAPASKELLLFTIEQANNYQSASHKTIISFVTDAFLTYEATDEEKAEWAASRELSRAREPKNKKKQK